MGLDLQRHHRQSIRLRGYAYTQNGAYFVTVCTWQKECILRHFENGMMIPSQLEKIVNECWYGLPKHFPNVALDEFVIMPNHVHGILAIVGPVGAQHAAPLHKPDHSGEQPNVTSGSLGAIIRSFKSAVTKRINEIRNTPGISVWQRNYYEHIIRDERELERIREYIVNNPAKWETDTENPEATKKLGEQLFTLDSI